MSWPLAFSTLGCSGLPIAEVVKLARTYGCGAVELRSADDEPVNVALGDVERRRVVDELATGSVLPLAVATYVRVADPDADDDEVVAAALAEAELAAALGAPFVRVFPGGADEAAAVTRLRAIADAIEGLGVAVALESHDSHPRGVDVARVLAAVDDVRVRTIWDLLHPWRHGEELAVTADALADHLAYVQIKDVAGITDLTPVLPGTGALPLGEFATELERIGYTGWVSLEWEAKWHPEAPPLAAALAGPAIADFRD